MLAEEAGAVVNLHVAGINTVSRCHQNRRTVVLIESFISHIYAWYYFLFTYLFSFVIIIIFYFFHFSVGQSVDQKATH